MTPVALSALFDHMVAEQRAPERVKESGSIQDLMDLKAMVAAHG